MSKAAILLFAFSSAPVDTGRAKACELMQFEGIGRVNCEAHYSNVFAHSWNAGMTSADKAKLVAECEPDGITPARQAFYDTFAKEVHAKWPDFSLTGTSKERWREVAWLSAELCMSEER